MGVGLYRRGVLEDRLAAWKYELATNKYGMAHLANRAIHLIEAELAEVSDGKAGEDV